MDGLLVAEQLALLPASALGQRPRWRFPDRHTFVLALDEGALWIYLEIPHARFAFRPALVGGAKPHGSFQELLLARATGPLLHARQRKLDRVVYLDFGPASGFVDVAPARLIVELTGRNSNLILVDERGLVIGALREVGRGQNRYRQIRPGLRYIPPPPYDKLDPRVASRDELLQALSGVRLKDLPRIVDGVGPQLTQAIAVLAELPQDTVLTGESVEHVADVLKDVAGAPSRAVAGAGSAANAAALLPVEELRAQNARDAAMTRAKQLLTKERDKAKRRLRDAQASFAADDAETLRKRADILLAFGHLVPKGVDSAKLEDFEGRVVELPLDPRLSAHENAQALYQRARKRELRKRQAAERTEALRARLQELEDRLQRLDALSDDELAQVAEQLDGPSRTSQGRQRAGVRYISPQGFSVLVGRNAKDNDAVTFRVARSRDVWLHAQGYEGSHVVVQAQNKEVPFETILFAAQLAAGHSRARDSDNVPVDYTLRKHVWRQKGGPPGAVHFTQQKTVFVTPSRQPATQGQELAN